MVRYFLTDLRGNPIYSFAQRLRRNNNNNHQQQQQLLLRNSRLFHPTHPHEHHDHEEEDVENPNDLMMDGVRDTTKHASPPPKSSPLQPQLQQQCQLYHVKNFSSLTLVCYVRNQQWEDVMKRISQVQYHHEIYMVDTTTGNTILHTVCRYNPPSYIVKALCHPDTVRHGNYDGTTPLHIAASHRCSKDALQTLFNCCRLYYNNNHNNNTNQSDGDEDKDELGQQQQQHPQLLRQHTSPTADLSRMGRAPIHYACMSFRGLDLEAFKVLLNETLQYGNIWVDEHTNPSYHHHRDEDDVDDMDLEFNDNSIAGGAVGVVGGGKKGIMEVVNEHEVYGHDDIDESRDDHTPILYEFENETDQSLYQLYGLAPMTDNPGWKSSASSVDNDGLTLECDKSQCYQHDHHHDTSNQNHHCNNNKILVNVMGMKDATGQTPIGLLFRRYRERVRCVINTVDKIRSTTTDHNNNNNSNNNNNKAALVAAIQVHADLGELWERARWIISRLTEERLLREQQERSTSPTNTNQEDTNTSCYPPYPEEMGYPNVQPRDMTSRRTSYYGGSKGVVPYTTTTERSPPARRSMGSKKNECFYDDIDDDEVISSNTMNHSHHSEPPSPIAQEAASWACELHPPNRSYTNDAAMMMLPFAPDISTSTTMTSKTFTPNQHHSQLVPNVPKNHHFRIVHASVGLTGYGCPPELIRLAISIHPNQVMEMDLDGNLPIHIAVTAASYLAYTNPMEHNSTNHASNSTTAAAAAFSHLANHYNPNGSSYNSVGDDHSSVMSDAALSFFSTATVSQTTNPFDQVIKILLQHYPDSARVPQGKSGRLPLVLAIEESKIGRRRTWNDGIRTLLHAYPPALHNKKIIEPILYPHVLSLVANNGTTTQSQQSSYHSPDGSNSFAFDFSGYVDVVPNHRHAVPTSISSGIIKKRHQQQKDTNKKSKRTIRQELCCRTTLYELLRSKPDWLTLGLSSTNI